MIESLFTYIEKHSDMILKDDEKHLIISTFRHKKVLKRRFFLEEGNVGHWIGFVVKGALRQYTTNKAGQEYTTRFAIENWWIGDYESFANLTPAKHSIEAIEDSDLLLIDNEQQQMLKAQIPAYLKMQDLLDKRGLIAYHTRAQASISLSAEEKYLDLLKRYPEFFIRFTRNMIASYLGMTPETLSRVRTQHLNNSKNK